MGKLTRAQIISLRAEAKALRERQGMQVLVCAGTGWLP